MRSTPLLFVSLVAAASLSSVAGASMVQIVSNQPGSTEMLGRFTGSITYTSNTLSTGTLTIVLNNTNTAGRGLPGNAGRKQDRSWLLSSPVVWLGFPLRHDDRRVGRAQDFSLGDFHLRRHDHFVATLDPRGTAAHQLGGAQP